MSTFSSLFGYSSNPLSWTSPLTPPPLGRRKRNCFTLYILTRPLIRIITLHILTRPLIRRPLIRIIMLYKWNGRVKHLW